MLTPIGYAVVVALFRRECDIHAKPAGEGGDLGVLRYELDLARECVR
jgi:hypothetical protein